MLCIVQWITCQFSDLAVSIGVIICPCLWCSAEDEEDTIAAQEVVEGEADHAGELDDLAKEGYHPHY